MPGTRIPNLTVATSVQPDDLLVVNQSDVTKQLAVSKLQTETVYEIVDGVLVDLDPDNGTIQTWTLGANRSPTESFVSGQSMTLMVDDGSGRTITWPSVAWVGGSPPTLATSGYSVIVLWKVDATLYGYFVGGA
jgi:hypothetical protein